MKNNNKCKCGWPFMRDNRHVGPMGMEDCKPADNLEYLEFLSKKKEDDDEQSKAKRPKRVL